MTAAEDTATLDAALDWHAAGQRPIPIRADGSKAPIVPWTEFRRTRPDLAVIRRWFPAGTCRGIGIVTGTLTGTEMLECEHEAAARGFPDRIRDLLLASAHPEVWALLAGTYIEDSPSGGIHWYYRITGGDVPPNTPLARRPSTPAELQAEPTKPTRVLIETRGEGGYSVVAPTGGSVHKTGRPWTARDGCTPHRMAELTVDQVAELHRVCRALDEMPAPRPHPPSPAGRSMAAGVFATGGPVTGAESVPAALNGSFNGSNRSRSVKDDYNAAHSCTEILTAHGWTCTGPNGSRPGTLWAKPGETGTEHHASLGAAGVDRVKVFSTAAPIPESAPGTSYDAFGLTVWSDYGGDFRRATRELAATGRYGVPSKPAGTDTTARPGSPVTAEPASLPTVADLLGATTTPETTTDRREPVTTATVIPIRKDTGPTPAEMDEFWSARPELSHIRTYALSKHVSPWSLLGVCLVRALLTVPPNVVLPPFIGGDASLNLFMAAVGTSGHGKGAAENAAKAALILPPGTDFPTVPLGSGEGMSRSFARRTKDGDLEWDHRRVLFSASEVDSLTALSARAGATLPEQLRKLFMGESIGFGYATPEKRVILPGHSYRSGLLIGVQPNRAAGVLSSDEGDGGTPQRFLWMPTRITRPRVVPPVPPPWKLPDLFWSPAGRPMFDGLPGRELFEMPAEVEKAVIDAHYAKHDPTVRTDPLDGHAQLIKEKVAAALGVMTGRKYGDSEDWQLAAVPMAVSDATRAEILAALSEKERTSNRARGRAEGERQIAAATVIKDDVVTRTAQNVARKVRAAGELEHRALSRSMPTKESRHHLGEAIARLIGTGQIRQDGEIGQQGPGKGARYVWTGGA